MQYLRRPISLLTAIALAVPGSFALPRTAQAGGHPCQNIAHFETRLAATLRADLVVRRGEPGDEVTYTPSTLCQMIARQRDNLIRHYQQNQKTGAELVAKASADGIPDSEAHAILTAKTGNQQQRNSLRQLMAETNKLNESLVASNEMYQKLDMLKKKLGEKSGQTRNPDDPEVDETQIEAVSEIIENLDAMSSSARRWEKNAIQLANQIGINVHDLEILEAKGIATKRGLSDLFTKSEPTAEALDGMRTSARMGKDRKDLDESSALELDVVTQKGTLKPFSTEFSEAEIDPRDVLPASDATTRTAPAPGATDPTNPAHPSVFASNPPANGPPGAPPPSPLNPNTTPAAAAAASLSADAAVNARNAAATTTAEKSSGSGLWWGLGALAAAGAAVGGYFWWKGEEDEKKKKEAEKKAAQEAAASQGPSPASVPEITSASATENLCYSPAGTDPVLLAPGADPCSAITESFLPKTDGKLVKIEFVCGAVGSSCSPVPSSGKIDVDSGKFLCAANKTTCGPALP